MFVLPYPKFLSCLVVVKIIPVFLPKSFAWLYWRNGDHCKWAQNCDFEGHDIYSLHRPGGACSGICADDSNCTHFTWTLYSGGTCWLKRGDNLSAKRPLEYSICGYVQRGNGGGSSSQALAMPYWRDGDRCKWAQFCDFEGQDLYSQQGPAGICSGICADDSNCTHFTWTLYSGGTCWLKRGDNISAKRPNEYSVCGYVQRGNGGGSSSRDLPLPDWRDGDRCKYTEYCDFDGHDLYSKQGPGEACSGKCADDGNCTHFTWTRYNGGTCYLKRGENLPAKRSNEYSLCGYVQRANVGESYNQALAVPDWRDGDRCKWTEYCDFEGHDLYSQQGPGEKCCGKCADDGGCTHFTWTRDNGGTCWLKRGDNLPAKRSNYSLCGYVQRGVGGRTSNQGGPDVQPNAFVYLLLIVACFGMIGLLISVALLRRQYKRKVALLKQLQQQLMAITNSEKLDPSIPIQQQTDNLPYYNSFELPRGCVVDLKEVIGQGEFGKVYHAVAYLESNAEPVQVAAKIPRDGMNVEHQKALLSELRIMLYLGNHVNILRLIGAITRNMPKGKLFVVTEYCKYGSLLKFLSGRQNLFVDEIVRLNSSTELRASNGNDSDVYLAPKPMRITYRSQQDPTWSDHLMSKQATSGIICTTDLLSFCCQTSNGMAFLASKNLIHRDLAARNVLLADGFVVKICDFGLARNDDTYQTKKSLHVPRPVRWMALESIKYGKYAEKSDVWSFGVLLWEVFTLGEVPYSQVNYDKNFVHMLENGHRLQQSPFCPDDVYALMRRCWAENPDLRPNFAECEDELETQLGLCSTQKLEHVKRLVLIGSSGTGFNHQAQNPAYFASADARQLSHELSASSCTTTGSGWNV